VGGEWNLKSLESANRQPHFTRGPGRGVERARTVRTARGGPTKVRETIG
jgi:hypothetical protein